MRPMSKILLTLVVVIALISCSKKAFIQDERVPDVIATINQLFDGMRTNDSTAVRTAFHEDARMNSVFVTPSGEIKLQLGSLDDFVVGVGRAKDKAWNEVLDDIVVQIDGQLAQVWTPYRFFLGDDQFLHCGVNAFHLVDEGNGWQILQITDTRRKEGCQDDNK